MVPIVIMPKDRMSVGGATILRPSKAWELSQWVRLDSRRRLLQRIGCRRTGGVMLPMKSSGDVNGSAAEAGMFVLRAVDLNREDFALRALHYPLLGLSVHGLSDQGQEGLVQLWKVVVEERDITPAVEKITNRKSASPIAIAIANIVRMARGPKWNAMLGSVLGAHAAINFSAGGQPDIGLDVVGAIVG